MCSYDSANREFAWVNRPYELTRNGYNAMIKRNRDANTPRSEALSQSPCAKARANLKSFLEKGDRPAWPLQRHDHHEDCFNLELSPTPRRSAKARVVARDKGKEAAREGRPLVQPMLKITSITRWKSSKCDVISVEKINNIEGTHKCQSCFKWLIAWSDGRIATEVCRMEITAKKTNKVFSLDKINFEKQPRGQRVSDRTRADQRRAAEATSAI